MPIAFFVSSLGDTDLAKAAITKLLEQNSKDTIFVIPLTPTAVTRTEDLTGNNLISRVSIEHITEQKDILTKHQISLEELEKVSSFVKKNNIQRMYVGVPSISNEIPFQIANHLNIPSTIAYEYMFKPANHSLWSYLDKLVSKGNCDFAVPLQQAKKDILEINPNAKIYEIGHLSIDRAQVKNTVDIASLRKSLSVNIQDELIFISGTTQPTEVDNLFLDALLSEIATGKYPHVQLRMGLHPGVKDPDSYLQTLLKTCEKYPKAKDQFKIILTTQFEKRLQHPLISSFILRSEVSGADAALAADKVAQAVPGALLNEAALNGKPSYFHDQTTAPYLPKKWFSDNISTFFIAKPGSSHSRGELGLEEDSAPNLLVNLMMR
jgi:hypothetical protein